MHGLEAVAVEDSLRRRFQVCFQFVELFLREGHSTISTKLLLAESPVLLKLTDLREEPNVFRGEAVHLRGGDEDVAFGNLSIHGQGYT